MKIINNKWTDSEIRQLKREYGTTSTGELAARLNKSTSAVTSKVHYLRRRGWTFNRKTDVKVRKVTPAHGITQLHTDKTLYNRKNAKKTTD